MSDWTPDQHFGQYLLRQSALTADQLKFAEDFQRQRKSENWPLWKVLVELSLLDESTVRSFWQEAQTLDDSTKVNESAEAATYILKEGEKFAGRIGKYSLLNELGRGGMGQVFVARDEQLGRMVALKRVLSTDSSTYADRFAQEARLAARLRHPGIATILDYEATGPNAPYLIMELIPGQTLASRVTSPMEESRACEILIQLCEAMIHAHSNDVIHRDLKPSNIILGDDGKATILDFGIAKDSKGMSLTQTGQQLGTAGYMAPEQLDNSKTVTVTADVYSLGAILYYCLTGLAPYEEAGQQLVFAVLSQDPRSPRQINAEVSKEMDALVMKCLKRKTSERFQSCQELIHALENIKERRAVGANIGILQGAPWFIFILLLCTGGLIGGVLFTFQPVNHKPGTSLRVRPTEVKPTNRKEVKEEKTAVTAPEPELPPTWLKPIKSEVTFATKEFRGKRLLSSYDRNTVRVREKGMKMYFTSWRVEHLGRNYYALSVASLEDRTRWYLTVDPEPSQTGEWWVRLTEKRFGQRSTWQLRKAGIFVQLQSVFASLDKAFVLDIYEDDIKQDSPAHRPVVAPLNSKRRYQLWRQR